MEWIDIGVLAERSGVPPSTLRYYEAIGLIAAPVRHGLRRQFGPEAVLQLALISLGKLAGFSLAEIKAMLGKGGAPELPRAALHARADEIEGQIRKLATLRDALRHVADCPAASHLDCPKFRRSLGMVARAGHGQARRRGPAPVPAPLARAGR